MTVCLIALKGARFELYGEPADDDDTPPSEDDGWYARWSRRASAQWAELVDSAGRGEAVGRFARWRDAVVCHLAETLAEQRTLWALRRAPIATLLYPAMLNQPAARQALQQALGASRRHHAIWLTVDMLMLTASAVLAPIPGPNAIAYYLAFRVVGHLQSWRGAHRGLTKTTWTLLPDEDLAELAGLVHAPRAERASRVADIAERLHLPQLPAYFERVAA
jgi:hypothetical protein